MSPIVATLIAAGVAITVTGLVFAVSPLIENTPHSAAGQIEGALRWIGRASIWHPDAIPPDEWKYRHLKRVWLPFYDVVAIGAGVWAAMFGAPLLHSLFDEPLIDVMGIGLAGVAAVCLLGIAFPRLWRWEIAGKVTLMSLLGAYAFAVAAFRTNPDPAAGFVAFILVLAIPLPLFRLQLLGEEIKERREEYA